MRVSTLDQQDKLQRAGMKLNDVLRLQGGYYNHIAAAVPTSNAADYLRTFNEMRSVVGGDRAEKITPWALQLESIISNSTGKSAEGEGFKLWRAMEMTGRSMSDPAGTSKLANALAQNIIGSGGKLDANTFQSLAKRGGVSFAHAAPEFVAGPLSVVAADLGGDTAGTALQTLYQMTSGATVLGKQQAQELSRLGMIKPGFLTYNEGGDVTSMKPGGLVGGELAMKNPYEWMQKVLMPHLHETYGTDATRIEQAMAKIGRNRNTIRMLTMFSDPGFVEQIEKDIAMWGQTSTVEGAYGDALKRNPRMIKQAFEGQYESMMQAIGAPAMQAALPVMKAVTSMFTSIGAFANANPRLFENLAKGMAELGSAAIVGGLGLMVGGPAGGLIGALAGGLGSLIALNWEGLKTYVTDAQSYLSKLIAGFQDFGAKLLDWLNGLLWKLNNWIGNAWGSIKNMLPSWMGGGGGGGGAGYNGPAIPRSGSQKEHLDWTADYAKSRGLNPEVIKRVMGSEGLYNYVGDGGSSFGDFQLHKGGLAGGGNRFSGLGDLYERQTGHRLTDAADWKSQNKWAIDHIAKTNNLSPWHGWHGHPGAARMTMPGPPPKSEKQSRIPDIHLEINGRAFAKVLGSEIARLHEHTTQAPYASRGLFVGPDHQFATG